jgi:hypothetical protein
VFGLRVLRVRPEVELVHEVRVEAGKGVGSGSELEVGVLVEKRNFAELAGEFARDYFGSVTKPVSVLGCMVRQRWKDPAPSVVQTQAPKTKVSPRLKATVGLM